MNHLGVALAARAFTRGRAVRSVTVRHRRLAEKPLAVVVWQLGGEPFSAAALAYGESPDARRLTVAVDPRDRDQAFAALAEFAAWFNPRFEAHAAAREEVTVGKRTWTRARTAPQVLVANPAKRTALGNLGRRLAYLKDGDPALPRLGRHLLFLRDRAATPGQQVAVCMTDLMNAHWATPLSDAERQHLPTLDAWAGPGGHAAAAVEDVPAGPVPPADVDRRLDVLVTLHHRGRDMTPAVRRHFHALSVPVWGLLWRCRDRELALPEARSVGRRWDEDRDAYTRHVDWLASGGRRRLRHTARGAAIAVRQLENATGRLAAEEATDDPLRMAATLLAGGAVRGVVTGVDRTHKEVATKRSVARPLVTLRTPDPCPMPAGKELWWSERPANETDVVHAVTREADGWRVVLKLMTSAATAVVPAVGAWATFSEHHVDDGWFAPLPDDAPWTHAPADAGDGPGTLEEAHA